MIIIPVVILFCDLLLDELGFGSATTRDQSPHDLHVTIFPHAQFDFSEVILTPKIRVHSRLSLLVTTPF